MQTKPSLKQVYIHHSDLLESQAADLMSGWWIMTFHYLFISRFSRRLYENIKWVWVWLWGCEKFMGLEHKWGASFPVFGYILYIQMYIWIYKIMYNNVYFIYIPMHLYMKFMFIYIHTHTLHWVKLQPGLNHFYFCAWQWFRGQFVGGASCAQQGSYLWGHKFELRGNQFHMKLCQALTVTLSLCRFI